MIREKTEENIAKIFIFLLNIPIQVGLKLRETVFFCLYDVYTLSPHAFAFAFAFVLLMEKSDGPVMLITKKNTSALSFFISFFKLEKDIIIGISRNMRCLCPFLLEKEVETGKPVLS